MTKNKYGFKVSLALAFLFGGKIMRGFRKINGVNWLDEVHVNYCVNNGATDITSIGKLPLHWNKVRGILLNNY